MLFTIHAQVYTRKLNCYILHMRITCYWRNTLVPGAMEVKAQAVVKKIRSRNKDPLHDVIGHIKKNQTKELVKLELKENEHLLELFRQRLQESRVPSDRSPLVVAILNNTFETFKYVIENFEVNLEQETSAVIEGGYPVEGATPLWTASTLGLLKFVQILVERGAEIEHTTDSRSTPLRGAAFDGHCEVCEFLIGRGADIDKPNQVGQSPLTIAAAMKKTDCVQLLIKKGANVNHRGHNGDTPLHVCVESGAVKVAEILVEAGAKNNPNEVGFTPSILACCYGHDEVMEFLDSRFKLDPKERYNCYCLLAAKEVLGSNELKAEEWLTKAVTVRSQNSLQFADLPRADKIYDNLQEPTNRQEIDWILQDETSMFFVSAIFCERILGRIHPTTAFYIRISGDMALSEERWEKCIELWHRSLDFDHAARMAYELQITEDLMFSTRGFCIMSKNDFRPPVEPHFRWGLKEFQLAHESKISQVEVICCLSRMLAAWIQIMDKIEDKTQQLQEHEKINSAVKDLLKVSGSLKISLITACLQNLPQNNGGASKDITNGKLPFHLVLSKLLDFECPLQCEDLAGNYPLHLAVQLKEDSALECVRTLIEYGCHVDAVNYNGETALDIAMRECGYTDLQSEIIAELKKSTFQSSTLQCLASRTILSCSIDYASILPSNLVQFVSWHESDPLSSDVGESDGKNSAVSS